MLLKDYNCIIRAEMFKHFLKFGSFAPVKLKNLVLSY